MHINFGECCHAIDHGFKHTLISAGVNMLRRTTVAGIVTFASSRPPAPDTKNAHWGCKCCTRESWQVKLFQEISFMVPTLKSHSKSTQKLALLIMRKHSISWFELISLPRLPSHTSRMELTTMQSGSIFYNIKCNKKRKT